MMGIDLIEMSFIESAKNTGHYPKIGYIFKINKSNIWMSERWVGQPLSQSDFQNMVRENLENLMHVLSPD